MGYYTTFELQIKDKETKAVIDNDSEYIKEIENIYDESGINDNVKWYDYNENMLEYSKKYPQLIFELSGNGEEEGDMWINYYVNGKVQYAQAKITFDEFDESKLQ